MCPWSMVNATEWLSFKCALIYLIKLDRAVVGNFAEVFGGSWLGLEIVICHIRNPKSEFASFGMSKSLILYMLLNHL